MLNTKTILHTMRDVNLRKYGLWTINGDRRGDVISCQEGTLWITQQDDMRDYILDKGQDFWVTRPGTILVQALQDAQFKYNLNELESSIEGNVQPAQRIHRPRLNRHLR